MGKVDDFKQSMIVRRPRFPSRIANLIQTSQCAIETPPPSPTLNAKSIIPPIQDDR